MFYLIGLVFVIPIIVGALHWGGRWRWKKEENSWGNGEGPTVVVCSLLAFLFYLIVLLIHLTNYSGVEQWEAFYNNNTQNYQIAIDKTSSYLSSDLFKDVLVQGSVEKLQQAGYVSERIKEFRDSANTYNTTLASLKYFNNNPIFGVLVPDKVEDMKFLVIK